MMSSFDKLNRVPPTMPIIWQDWAGSLNTQRMTVSEEGFFFRLLLKQWELGELPADPWLLSRLLRTNYATTKTWLQKWSHLVVTLDLPCSEHKVNLKQGCRECRVTLQNEKLKNLKTDVLLGLPLGTTEPQPKPNRTGSEPQLAPSATGGGGGGVFNPVVDEYFNQANPVEPMAAKDPLVDEFMGLLGMAKPPAPTVYNYWSAVFARLVEAHGEPKFKTIMAYCFSHERYGRGVKTVKKQDKADWLAEHFEEIGERMLADEEFDAKRGAKAAKYRVPENAPDYIKNPSGNVSFGKSVV